MKALAEDLDLDRFFDDLRRARRRVLMVDYDGCLAPFQVERHRAVPYPGVREHLRALQDDHATRLVIISGRRAAELPPLLGLSPRPEIWGAHGLERWLPDGRRLYLDLGGQERRGLEAAERAARRRGLGGLLERKPGSLALHWRGLDDETRGAVEREVLRVWAPAAEQRLELRRFDGGLELRSPRVHKGQAVAALVAEAGPDAVFAYLGDDLTDEDAFAALPPGGLSVLVREQPRPTRARLWVQPPHGLLAFLDRWLAASAGEA
ncbi:MAG: trehalose-phosphatase [Acidobacteriota bacterium]